MGMNQLDLNSLLDRILTCALTNKQTGNRLADLVPEEEIFLLCSRVRLLLLSQPALLEVEPPLNVCGDIHGQFVDLVRIFNRCKFPPHGNYLFLGDYVDRGKQSLEVICLLFCYKAMFAENFFLLRGNHEVGAINKVYGFYSECANRYSVRLWQIFLDVFNCMPFCAIVGGIFFCHGGLSPQFASWNQIRNVVRPIDPPTTSVFTDLLWSDPHPGIKDWELSPRGISFLFGENAVREFCQEYQIDLIARAHQVVFGGFEFFANRKLVTIFSAPNYCGDFDNSGAIMTVDKNLHCCFQVFKPSTKEVHIRKR